MIFKFLDLIFGAVFVNKLTLMPKFIIFTNYPDSLKESYKRFLISDIKKTFNFDVNF